MPPMLSNRHFLKKQNNLEDENFKIVEGSILLIPSYCPIDAIYCVNRCRPGCQDAAMDCTFGAEYIGKGIKTASIASAANGQHNLNYEEWIRSGCV